MESFSEVNNQLVKNTANQIKKMFPIETSSKRLELAGPLSVQVNKDIYTDIPAQKETKLKRKSWTIPLMGKVKLIDKKTGEVLSEKTMKLVDIPMMTNRYSFIIGGNSYSSMYQWRLKPGIYTRLTRDGIYESTFNLALARLTLRLDPQTLLYYLTVNDTTEKFYLYPILRTYGITDRDMEAKWGKPIFDKNKVVGLNNETQTLVGLARKVAKVPATEAITVEQAKDLILKYFAGTILDSGVVELNVGVNSSKINPEVLLATSEKLLKVMKGVSPEDERDSLAYKDLYNVADRLDYYLDRNLKTAKKKIEFKMKNKSDVTDLLTPEILPKLYMGGFLKDDLISPNPQTNPLEMLLEARKTTVTGPGGIQSSHAITDDVRNIHPSHIGILDPLQTPEGSKVGVTVPLSVYTKKVGKSVKTEYIQPDGKTVLLSPTEVFSKTLGFPGEYTMINGRPVAKEATVKGYKDGVPGYYPAKDIDIYLKGSYQLWSLGSSLVPFLNSNSGNRAAMAGRMMTQAVQLTNPEAPLVHVKDELTGNTWNKMIGNTLNIKPNVGFTEGKVIKVDKNYITIKEDKTDKVEKLGLYNNFPLNQESFLDSTPLVKVGDTVNKNTVLAKNNFQDDSLDLALGKNVNVAYMPWKGLNVEDGTVVTEHAANDLFVSESIQKETLNYDNKVILDLNKYRAIFPEKIPGKNVSMYDSEGVIKQGSKVVDGDILIAALRQREFTPEQAMLNKLNKQLAKPYVDMSIVWDNEEEGTVIYVNKGSKRVDVHVKMKSPLHVGDKVAGSWGNKMIVTKIIPDSEAPHTKDGRRADLIMHPFGIIGRTNIGQLLATAGGKIAQKTGKPYIITNFENESNVNKVMQDLKDNNVEPNEEMFDGQNGKPFEKKIFFGPQYILKLKHTAEHKLKTRGLGSYDVNEQVVKGKEGGQSIDPLQWYAMLAHGLKNNLGENTKYLTSKNDEFWRAVQLGLPIPKPQRNFVWDKFSNYLRGTGISLKRDGNTIKMMPSTDADTLKLSNGEITNHKFFVGKNLGEIKGGFFDPDITGGMSGDKFSHIELAERIPNPIYEDTLQKLMGYTKAEYKKRLAAGTLSEDVSSYLKNLNVDTKLTELQAKMAKARRPDVGKLNYQIRVLKNLKQLKMSPFDAFTMKYVPVIPPKFRPIYPLPNGDLNASPINMHYKDIGLLNSSLKDAKSLGIDTKDTQKAREQLYLAVKAAEGLGDPVTYDNNKEGLLKTLAGNDPASGFIQGKLWRKRRDLSARAVATIDPSLGIDEVGISNDILWNIYKPFIIRELVKGGLSPAVAAKNYKDKTAMASKSLDIVLENRPIFLNRAPSLHKHSVVAYKVRRTNSKSIQTNPLTMAGLNLDLDGDSVSTYITIHYSISELVKTIKTSNKIKDDFTLDIDTILNYISSINLKQGVKMLTESYLNYMDTGNDSSFNIHIKDFPHTGEITKETENVIEYRVPDFIKVHALDGNKIILKSVSKFSVHKNLKMFKVTSSSGKGVIASEDHSLICFNPKTGLIDKIKPEMSVGLLTPIPASLEVTECNEQSFDFGWLVGAFVGDSWVNKNNSDRDKNKIMLANVNKPTIEKFAELVGTKGYSLSNEHTFEGHICHSTKTTWSNKKLATYFREKVGNGAINKNIPRDFLTWGKEALYGIISGLFDTDGSLSISHSKNKPQYMASYCTISEELQYQIQQLFAAVGVRTSISPYERNNKTVYGVSISMVDLIKIRENLHLTVEKKQRILTEATVSRDIKDIIPISFELAKELQQIVGNYNDDINAIFTKTIKSGHLSRTAALSILNIVDPLLNQFTEWEKNTDFSPNYFTGILSRIKFPSTSSKDEAKLFLSKLMEANRFNIFKLIEKIKKFGDIRLYDANLVMNVNFTYNSLEEWKRDIVFNKDLFWDTIRSIEPSEETTGYDITVPGPFVFMTSNLLTVQDTVSVYPPVTTEAVEEAWNALPSRNPYRGGTQSVIHGHTWDYKVGLFYATKKGDNTGLKFKTIEQARLHTPALKYSDVFLLNGKEMTLGLWEANEVLPPEMRDYDRAIDAKIYERLLQEVVEKYPNYFSAVINRWKDLGYNTAFVRGQTLSITDMVQDQTFRNSVMKTAYADIKKDPKQLLPIMAEAETKIEKHQNEDLKKSKNNAWDFIESKALSGAKGKNINQVLSMVGLVADLKGNPVKVPIGKSWSEGQSPFDYWSSLYGARKGSVDRSVNTQDTGYLNKVLLNNTASMVITEHDCGTDQFITETQIEPIHIIGRVLAIDVKGVGKKDEVIDPKMFNAIKQKGLSSIDVRSPLTCEAVDNGICQLCYGWKNTGQFPTLGENVGISDSQAITERLTQATMRTFHCYHPGSSVYTEDHKLMTMETLHKINYKGKVLDLNGNYTEVKNIWEHEVSDTVKYVKTKDGHSLILQQNHPVQVVENTYLCKFCGGRLKSKTKTCNVCNRADLEAIPNTDFTTAKTVELRDVTKGKFGFIVNSFPSNFGSKEWDWELDPYMLGAWIAEGSINRRKINAQQNQVIVSQSPGTEIFKKYSTLLGKAQSGKSFHLTNQKLADRLELECGSYSFNKRLPFDILNYSKEDIYKIIAGILDGGGTIQRYTKGDGNDLVILDTTSYSLANQMVILGKALGISVNIHQATVRKISRYQPLRVSFKFTMETITFIEKNSIKLHNLNLGALSHYIDENTIKQIQDTFYPFPTVYDIETESSTLLVNEIWVHNSAGKVGTGGLAEGFDRVDEILRLKQNPQNQGTLSQLRGTVNSITNNPAGGYNVAVNDTLHYVPVGRDLVVKKGQSISAGDPISTGVFRPQDLVAFKGIDKGRKYMVDQLQNTFSNPNEMSRRTVETVVKGITDRVKITNPQNDPNFVRGDYASENTIKRLNKERKSEGLPAIEFEPYLKNIDILPDSSNDWAVMLGGRNLKKTITSSAALGRSTNLHGTHPLPGYMYGLDFGNDKKYY